MATEIISTPTVTINNETIMIVPNSFQYTLGRGEQSIKTQSAGGGSVETVYADNAETRFSKFKFKMRPTVDNLSKPLTWKNNRNTNAVRVTGQNVTSGAYLTLSFNNAAFAGDPEITLGVDGEMELEWASDSVVGQ